MRWSFVLVLAACSGSSSKTTEVTQPTGGSGSGSAPAPTVVDWRADPDGDHFPGTCDACPDAAETKNYIADQDGCPETEAEIATVREDPRVLYSDPLVTVSFVNGKPTSPYDRPWDLEPEIEKLACAAGALDAAVATKRANDLCDAIEKSVKSKGGKLVTERYGTTGSDGARVIILRAKGMDIWKREGDDFVRTSPKPDLPGKPVAAQCTLQRFKDKKWCDNITCPINSDVETFIGIWPIEKPYPKATN